MNKYDKKRGYNKEEKNKMKMVQRTRKKTGLYSKTNGELWVGSCVLAHNEG